MVGDGTGAKLWRDARQEVSHWRSAKLLVSRKVRERTHSFEGSVLDSMDVCG